MASQRPNGIVYRSKAHVAYLDLRERIVTGDLKAGASLNQEQLAAEMGVSTTPLREALRKLETEGFVVGRSHKDVYVAPLDPEEVTELYAVRSHLDALAARLAAENLDDEARSQIEEAAAALGSDDADPVAANRRFHRAIYTASKNEILVSVLDGLWDRSDRYRRFTRNIADRKDVIASHNELAQAIFSGDGDTSEAKMLEHVEGARAVIGNEVVKALKRAEDEDAAAAQPAASK
jgi:DNA-binding GntR family transcriptional regulator